jgi:acylphosphatase
MKNLRLTIRGNVQGVFFRAETKKMADLLGVKGYIKNQKDGSVFVEAEGNPDAVHKLIDYCHHGPEKATVERVSIVLGELAQHTSFDILRE